MADAFVAVVVDDPGDGGLGTVDVFAVASAGDSAGALPGFPPLAVVGLAQDVPDDIGHCSMAHGVLPFEWFASAQRSTCL